MRSKLLNADPPITYAVVLDTGDEVTGELGKFVREVAPAPCSRRRGNGLRGRRLGPFDCTLCTAQRRWVTERSFDRIDDLLGRGVMEHMPNTRDQPQRALRNLLMKPDTVFAMIYDAVLRACHDHHGHTQFPIAVLHCGHGRIHGGGILSLGADLRWPEG